MKSDLELLFPFMDRLVLIDQFLGAPRGFGDLGRRAIYIQGAGEHC